MLTVFPVSFTSQFSSTCCLLFWLFLWTFIFIFSLLSWSSLTNLMFHVYLPCELVSMLVLSLTPWVMCHLVAVGTSGSQNRASGYYLWLGAGESSHSSPVSMIFSSVHLSPHQRQLWHPPAAGTDLGRSGKHFHSSVYHCRSLGFRFHMGQDSLLFILLASNGILL